ncbi:MAG: flagellar motor switch protein FliN [Bryobacteraceae bacterium]
MPVEWVLDQFASCLGQSLAAMAERPPQIGWEAAPEAPAGDLLGWEQGFNGLPDAVLWVGAAPPAWEGLGRGILSAAGLEQVDTAEARSTYLELLSQSLASLAHGMSAQAGREVTCSGGAEKPVPSEGPWYRVTLRWPDVPEAVLAVAPRGFHALAPQTAPEPPHAARLAGPPESPVMDVLLDVELPVTVSFGSAQMPLADVLKLTTGSLVELNRAITEPVQVIVNNCVIARGEVVVVEGNYGVRIKEIASRLERLRNLR